MRKQINNILITSNCKVLPLNYNEDGSITFKTKTVVPNVREKFREVEYNLSDFTTAPPSLEEFDGILSELWFCGKLVKIVSEGVILYTYCIID